MTNSDILNALKIFIGSTEAEKLYIGDTLMYLSLPYDAEIEYLESTGTLYINTGVMNGANVAVELKMSALGTNCISGGEKNGSDSKFKFGSNGDGYIYYGIGSINFTSDRMSTLEDPYTFYMSQTSQSVTDEYGNVLSSTTSSVVEYSTTPLTLFRFKSTNGNFVSINGTTRIFYCNITDTNFSMQLIPVRVGSVGYLYDKISKQLFGNSGTGDFIIGPDKRRTPSPSRLPSGYTELKWIRSTDIGSQYIDLNIKLYETLDIDYDIATRFIIFSAGTDNLTLATLFGCLNETSPWPGTFIRFGTGKTDTGWIVGRYIGGTNKDNKLDKINNHIELPVQVPPNKNVTNLNNSNLITHNYGTSLFCAYIGDLTTPAKYVNAAINYFKLFVNGTLVRDMVPCKNSNNIAGLYDLVNGVFYPSESENAFIGGPEI